MKVVLTCLLASALSIAESCRAEEPWLVASLGSHHFSSNHYNQHNYGVGFEYPTSVARLAAIGGFYDNSFEQTSVYAGLAWTPLGIWRAHLGFLGGAVTNYSHPVLPLVLPTVQFEVGRVGLDVTYAPKVKDGASVLGFQAKIKF